MTDQGKIVKPPAQGSLAPLKNVMGFMALVTKLQQRGPHLPNLGVMHGWSGVGKSYASIYAQNRTRAVRVEVGESWNRKSFVRAILLECGVANPKGATADLVGEAIGLLGDEPNRPLIVDEADKLVDKGLIEIVREISEASQVPVLLIGEELLPQKLARVERVHNRVLDWYGAEPCDMEDARHLARIFLANAAIDDELLEVVRVKAEGRARRIVVTLSGMSDWARNKGVRELNVKNFDGAVYTGEAPKARSSRLQGVGRGR
ncbi:MAG: ATP-binding protein [Roseiarcus sp.]|jgi:DNA transposition AAA+ family ATPase